MSIGGSRGRVVGGLGESSLALGSALKACRWLQIESVGQCLSVSVSEVCFVCVYVCVGVHFLGQVLVSSGRRARSHEM